MTAIGFAASLPVWGGAVPALAGPVSITPTQVTLAARNATELITVLNEGDALARFEITVSAWSESEDGQTRLAPAADILVFPPLLELAPHGMAKIRLGAAISPGAGERAYRMVIQEIPSSVPPPGRAQIQVLTKISIPVFLAAPGGQPALTIEGARIEDGKLAFAIANGGTAHELVRRVEVTGQGKAGPSFDVGENGWYILAGGRRDYRVALAGRDCAATSQIAIAALGEGAKAEAGMQVPVASSGCAPGEQTRFVASSLEKAPHAPP